MTVDTKTQDAAQPTATLPIPEADPTFNWKNCWYPVAFLQDLPKDRPYSFSLYDEPLVLFRNQEWQLAWQLWRLSQTVFGIKSGQCRLLCWQ